MSLMYKLIKQGKNQEREKIARSLLGSGVNKQTVKEITGLSDSKMNNIPGNKNKY